MQNTSSIMGIPVPKMTMRETVDAIGRVIEGGRDQTAGEPYHVVTLNPEIAMACRHDEELRSIALGAGLLTADGIGIVMVSRMKGNPLPERVTGCDLLIHLLREGDRHQWSVYLLGASEDANAKAAGEIGRTYPNVSVLGRHHGYFSEADEARIVQEIADLQPDILVVALGAPGAERWIHRYRSRLKVKVAIGVGGSLDIIAGTVKRAPAVWQRMNAEWLFRLLNQPSRWRRQLILPRFAIRALLHREKG